MRLYRLGDCAPHVPESAFVAAEATLIGKVRLGEGTGVWFGAVLRGDNELISVGDGSNIQDQVVLHTDPGYPLTIGRNVTIGHHAMLHGCTIGDGSLIGIRAIVMNGAVIGPECLVGAGAIVTAGKSFPERSLILGVPAKAVRPLSDEEVAGLADAAADYVRKRDRYKAELAPVVAAASAA